MFSKILKQLFKNKFTISITILVVIIGGYFSYQAISGSNEAVRYAVAAVKRSTLIVSISGSGQVSASDQLDIKPKVSGDVVYVGVKNGQEVKAGDLLVQIDTNDAEKAVRDAQTSLETAKLELEELLQPADAYSLMQAENALIQAKDNLTKLKFTQESKRQDALDAIKKAEDNLEKAYEDGFNAVANAFLDLPTLITDLRNILHSHGIAKSEITVSNCSCNNISVLKNSVNYGDDRYQLEKFISSAETNYKTARKKYDENFENYKNASRYSNKEVIEALLNETLETTKAMAETVKSETNMLDYWVDLQSKYDRRIYTKVTEYQSDLKSYTSKTNSHLSSLLSVQRTLEDNKEAKLNAERDLREMEQNNPLDLATAERSVKEKEEFLTKLKAGPDDLDIRAKKNAIQQKEDILLDTQQNLADHYIRAPFGGIVTNINAKKGESVSSNAVVTLITQQKIAEITLNEIDIPKIKVGQKANITFDAIEDLNLTGEVVEIDTLGTVSQGVVTYGVKIAFDTQDERVKPGMTLTANIISDAKQDVLVLPSNAIKFQGNFYYVELVEADGQFKQQLLTNVSGIILPEPPQRQTVEVGLSNDLSSEIISGLKEGDIVVTSAINQTTQTQKTTKTQRFKMPMMGGKK